MTDVAHVFFGLTTTARPSYAMGSSIQIALFVTPVLVLLSGLVGPTMLGLAFSRLEIGVLSTTLAAGPAKADKLRVIAVTSAQRVGFAPDWPPLGETIAGFDAAPSIFLLAPAGTPAPVVARLNDATRKALGLPDLQQAFSNQGASATPGSPDALRAQIDGELKRWGAAAKAAGVTAN